MNTIPFETHTLACGLRVIYEPSDSPVLYCGIVVRAGTRHEEPADEGMAHFIEHMAFKGTERRSVWHITNGLERVGGELNAFTTKQETVYHATVLKDDFKRAADLLTDIVFHSVYRQDDITREVEVICDEIDSYEDTPSERIFDEYEALMFPDQGLGRDILGSKARLRAYTTADALRFVHRYYRPDNCVFFVCGQVPFATVVRTLERLMPVADFTAPAPSPLLLPPPVPQCGPRQHTVVRELHQAHVMVGAPAFAATDPRHYALWLMNNMLGGPGMNSRLNVNMREKAGLVYSVDSYLNLYPDTGYWNVYFGCDEHDVDRCRRILLRDLGKFYLKPLTPAQLAAAKKQLRGQTGIATDNREAYALAMGKTYAHLGVHRDVNVLLERLEAVTADEVMQVAREVYNPLNLITLIYA